MLFTHQAKPGYSFSKTYKLKAAEDLVKAYQRKIEEKYDADKTMVDDIIAKMASCNAAEAGKLR